MFYDKKNKIKCVVKLGKKVSGFFSKDIVDHIEGKIYYFNDSEN
jgi:hypothetical protein